MQFLRKDAAGGHEGCFVNKPKIGWGELVEWDLNKLNLYGGLQYIAHGGLRNVRMHEDQANTKENIVKSSRWEIKYRAVAERVFKGILVPVLNKKTSMEE